MDAEAPQRRRSIRWKGHDYSLPGGYFVTVCTKGKRCMFGDIRNHSMVLNDAGKAVHGVWKSLPERFPTLIIDEFIVMPNHFHAIVILTRHALTGRTQSAHFVEPTLGDVVGAFKSLSTLAYIDGVRRLGWAPFDGTLWQRNYYEHVIRDEASLRQIRKYVYENPLNWDTDEENPECAGEKA